MEKIKEFLKIGSGNGWDYSDVWGLGLGSGSGEGSGLGEGSGWGEGSGLGSGSGSGSGWGEGLGLGSGSGSGWGSGEGSGWGSGEGLTILNADVIYRIDGIPTIIKSVCRNLAKGFIVNNDLTLSPCYIAKGNNMFAHGETAKKAIKALEDKIFEALDDTDKIAEFNKCHKPGVKYPAKDFYEWHHKLTGSCEMGRKQFVSDHGIDLDNGKYTVDEFVAICENAYGGDIIRKIRADGD